MKKINIFNFTLKLVVRRQKQGSMREKSRVQRQRHSQDKIHKVYYINTYKNKHRKREKVQNCLKKKVDRRGNGIQTNSQHERLLKHLQGWPWSDFFNWFSPSPLGTGKSDMPVWRGNSSLGSHIKDTIIPGVKPWSSSLVLLTIST